MSDNFERFKNCAVEVLAGELGEVVATGPGSRHRVGERVMALTAPPRGGLAEQALAHDSSAWAIPDTLGDAEAAAMPVAYLTAHVGLHRRGALRPGEVLLVHAGAGVDQ